MKRLKHLKCLRFFLFPLFLLFCINSFGVSEPPKGKILEITGTQEQVKIIRDTKRLPASIDAPLFLNDIAQTGDHSMIKMSLKNLDDKDMDFYVFENSEFQIEQKFIAKKRSTIVNLSNGFLSVVAKKLPKGEDIRIKTPNAVVGVRGSFIALLVDNMCRSGQILKALKNGKQRCVAPKDEDEEDEYEEDEEMEGPDDGGGEDDIEEGEEEEFEKDAGDQKEGKIEKDEDKEDRGEAEEKRSGKEPIMGTAILQSDGDIKLLPSDTGLTVESLDQKGAVTVPDGTMAALTTQSPQEPLKLDPIAPVSPTNVSVTLEGIPSTFNVGQSLTLAEIADGKVATVASLAESNAKEGAALASATTTANATSDTSASISRSEGPFRGRCP